MVTSVPGTCWSCRGGFDLPAGKAGNGLPESSLESGEVHCPSTGHCIWQFGDELI